MHLQRNIKKVQMRRAEGAICVDMECSALIAVSKFRNVKFIPILMASDDLEVGAGFKELVTIFVVTI